MPRDDTLIRSREPETVARLAFETLKYGLAKGEFEGFLSMLTDDVVMRFPKGRFAGTHHGKEKAAEYFDFVAQAFSDGLHVTQVVNVGVSGKGVMFELENEGLLFGKPYQGKIVVVLDVRGEKICGYREYLGSE